MNNISINQLDSSKFTVLNEYALPGGIRGTYSRVWDNAALHEIRTWRFYFP